MSKGELLKNTLLGVALNAYTASILINDLNEKRCGALETGRDFSGLRHRILGALSFLGTEFHPKAHLSNLTADCLDYYVDVTRECAAAAILQSAASGLEIPAQLIKEAEAVQGECKND